MIGERALAHADEIQYLSLDEALVLYAEIKGLTREAVDMELRDIGLLDSALMRPIDAAHYAAADLAEQAASLIWGIAENQQSSTATSASRWLSHLRFWT
jgi:hypothetical protein